MNKVQNSSDALSTTIHLVCLSFIAVLFALTIIFAHKVPDWQELSIQFLRAGVVYVAVVWLARRLSKGWLLMVVYTAAVLGLFAFLFKAVAGLQHIVVDGWMDDVLISMDYSLIGKESSVALQRVVLLTEWMMFAYVIYFPLWPFIALICYWSGGTCAANDYLLNVSLANVVCFLGFIIFPVASPLYHAPHLYTVPLEGGFFTWCGEWIRHNQHYAGGSLPSPHCADGSIMLAMLYRYNRNLFYLSLPVFLTLYVSTVYGRYHYAWDGIAGIISAIVVLKLSSQLVSAMDAVRTRLRSLFVTRNVAEPVSE